MQQTPTQASFVRHATQPPLTQAPAQTGRKDKRSGTPYVHPGIPGMRCGAEHHRHQSCTAQVLQQCRRTLEHELPPQLTFHDCSHIPKSQVVCCGRPTRQVRVVSRLYPGHAHMAVTRARAQSLCGALSMLRVNFAATNTTSVRMRMRVLC